MTQTSVPPSQDEGASASDTPPRRNRRRADGLAGTLGVTLLGTVLPGSGFLFAGHRLVGLLITLPAVAAVAVGGWYAWAHPDALLQAAVVPEKLTGFTVASLVVLTAWVMVVVATYLLVRPVRRTRVQTLVGSTFVVLLCVLVAAPLVVTARYSMVQRDLIVTVFDDEVSVTRSRDFDAEAPNPWGERKRVNVLLLGGDGDIHRPGVRTDSVILASLSVEDGRTVLFSLPRNLEEVPFPRSSPLHDLYPDGFTGYGDPGAWLLNAVYQKVPELHPGILGESDNEGADAVKLAVSAALGVRVDYYVLVNLRGFVQIVDAIGGVTVNINDPIPIGGVSSYGIAPEDYLEPGPDQRLNGYEALWYSRGRFNSSDYDRMERQRCMVGAIVEEADPLTLLRRYQKLAEAGKEIVRTDIPQSLLPAFMNLGLVMKDADLSSLAFVRSDDFSPSNPDFEWVRGAVEAALAAPPEAEPDSDADGDGRSDPAASSGRKGRGSSADDGSGSGGNTGSAGGSSGAAGPGDAEPGADQPVALADSCAYRPED